MKDSCRMHKIVALILLVISVGCSPTLRNNHSLVSGYFIKIGHKPTRREMNLAMKRAPQEIISDPPHYKAYAEGKDFIKKQK